MLPKILEVQLSQIKEADTNPNFMAPEKFERLKNGIEQNGFLQPILVSPNKDGTYTIVDGHHRFKAARDLGMPEIPCVLRTLGKDKKKVEAIAMNNLRGELNLTMVANDLADLVNSGWEIPDLEITGFSNDEIDAIT